MSICGDPFCSVCRPRKPTIKEMTRTSRKEVREAIRKWRRENRRTDHEEGEDG